MHHWQATWTPDGDSTEERHVRFEADYDRLADADRLAESDLLTRAYRETRQQKVIDEYALAKYWRLTDLTATYAAIGDTLGRRTYPELTAWLEGRPGVVAVRPRTPVVDVLLDSTEDGYRLEPPLRAWLDADASTTVERTRTRKPGAEGAIGTVPRLRLRTEFHFDEIVESHAGD